MPAVVHFKMAEAVSKQTAKGTFPHLIHLRGLKVSLPLYILTLPKLATFENIGKA
jgi:hypothetical protein